MRANLRMLSISEIVGEMFPRMAWDAGHWTPRMFILSDKNKGSFKMEIAWVKAEPTGSTE